MKPPPFDYIAATSVDHAVALLAEDGDQRVVAGGQSLLPILNLRLGGPDRLVDIGRIPELATIEVRAGSGGDDTLLLGANVTHSQLLSDDRVRDGWPLVAAAVAEIGHPAIRNRGTVGGSLAHNDPQAELPAVMLALGASVVARSPNGERRIGAAELFDGPFATVLDPDEILIAVEVPRSARGWSFRELALRPGDFALAGVVVTAAPASSRVVLFGVGPGPVSADAVGRALDAALAAGSFDPDAVVAVVTETVADLDPPDDAHGSASARRRIVTHLLNEATVEAWERAQ